MTHEKTIEEADWLGCESTQDLFFMMWHALWRLKHRAVAKIAIHVAEGVLSKVPLMDRRPRRSLAQAKAFAMSMTDDDYSNLGPSEDVRAVAKEHAERTGKDELPPSLSTVFWACSTLGLKFIDTLESCMTCAAMAIGEKSVCDLVREVVPWGDVKLALDANAAREAEEAAEAARRGPRRRMLSDDSVSFAELPPPPSRRRTR